MLLVAAGIRNRKRGWKFLFVSILFDIYISAVIAILFFPISIPLDWPKNLSWQGTLNALAQINLSPSYFLSFSTLERASRWLLRDIILNTLLTFPFGVGLGYLKKPGFFKLLLWALLTGLTLEGIQLVVKLVLGVYYHAVDINDVIINALGVLLGYALYRMIDLARKRKNNTLATPR